MSYLFLIFKALHLQTVFAVLYYTIYTLYWMHGLNKHETASEPQNACLMIDGCLIRVLLIIIIIHIHVDLFRNICFWLFSFCNRNLMVLTTHWLYQALCGVNVFQMKWMSMNTCQLIYCLINSSFTYVALKYLWEDVSDEKYCRSVFMLPQVWKQKLKNKPK